MNKTWTFILLASYLILMSVVAQSIELTTSTELDIVTQQFDLSLTGIWSVFGTFFKLLAFRVNGVPPLFTIIAIYPASLGILYIIISMVRGTE